MPADPFALHSSTPAELQLRQAAERRGRPFVFYRDGDGALRLHELDGAVQIGRRSACAISLAWDSEVSRAHAELAPVGPDWAIADDGLSQNGTFVNGARVAGRRRLRSGDVIRVGRTTLGFWAPPETSVAATAAGHADFAPADLTDAERRVLAALARPLRVPGGVPASNREIAEALFITIPTVKGHLRSLAEKFGLRDLPQTHRRHELVARALRAGVLIERDL
jgi:pSer/pThr/pTyr-binding forkhead associated (FHA) protein